MVGSSSSADFACRGSINSPIPTAGHRLRDAVGRDQTRLCGAPFPWYFVEAEAYQNGVSEESLSRVLQTLLRGVKTSLKGEKVSKVKKFVHKTLPYLNSCEMQYMLCVYFYIRLYVCLPNGSLFL